MKNQSSRDADKFVVRLPDGLRAEIEGAANSLDRSMNSVIVQAVRQYLDGQQRQQLLLGALAGALANTAPSRAITDLDLWSHRGPLGIQGHHHGGCPAVGIHGAIEEPQKALP